MQHLKALARRGRLSQRSIASPLFLIQVTRVLTAHAACARRSRLTLLVGRELAIEAVEISCYAVPIHGGHSYSRRTHVRARKDWTRDCKKANRKQPRDQN